MGQPGGVAGGQNRKTTTRRRGLCLAGNLGLPNQLAEPNYPSQLDIRRVRSNGEIKWGGDLISVSSALSGEWVAIEETLSGQYLLRFYDTYIGVIDTQQRRLKRLTVPARGHSQTTNQLSPTYPG